MPCEAPVTIATFGVGVILNAETPPMRRGLGNCSAGLRTYADGDTPTAARVAARTNYRHLRRQTR